MNANEVIEAYVLDVALRLPRRQRADVAFELRALLGEGLQARAESAGGTADRSMALALVREFGHPDEVAARYRPPLTIIDPADGHAFLRACVIGLLVIWGAALLHYLQLPLTTTTQAWVELGRVWVTTLVQSLFWPGLLVIGFGLSNWAGQRRVARPPWSPRDADRLTGGRAAQVLGIIGILFGLFILLDPHWLLDVVWAGRAAPAAYQALTYTDHFRDRQAPLLFLLVFANVPLLIAAIVAGRRSARLRAIETGLALATCAAMLWVVVDGPMMMTPASDQTARFALLLIAVLSLGGLAIAQYRRLHPAPDVQRPASAAH